MNARVSLALVLTPVLVLAPLSCKSKEEALQAAEEKARFLAEEKARLVKGVGEGLEKEGKIAGEQLAKGAAQVVRGVEGGAVEGISALPISVAEALGAAGLKAERAALHREEARGAGHASPVPQVKVYLVLDKPYKGELTLVARSKEGKEVGRSKLAIDEQATGKYVLFSFDPLVDLSIASDVELR